MAAPFMHLVAVMDIGLAPFDRKVHDAIADDGGKGGWFLQCRLAPSSRVEAQYLAAVHGQSGT
jgi:hypothetical protein